MNEIELVPFHGTHIHTVLGEDGEILVVLKPTIKSMGLDWSAQWTKLQRRSWGVVGQTPTTGADGKTYDMATCGLDTWSMLLANIDENKIKPQAREVLIAYQIGSAKALRDFWTKGFAVNPALVSTPIEPTRKELAKYWYEAEERAEQQTVRADKAEKRAEIAERKMDEYEGGPGMTLTRFHKKHFSEVPHLKFFEHLYGADYVIDERGKVWDPVNEEYKAGPRHLEPKAKGKPFLYLHEGGFYGKKRRYRTYVRPGNAELLFKAQLIKDGLRGNQHMNNPLFAIEGGAG